MARRGRSWVSRWALVLAFLSTVSAQAAPEGTSQTDRILRWEQQEAGGYTCQGLDYVEGRFLQRDRDAITSMMRITNWIATFPPLADTASANSPLAKDIMRKVDHYCDTVPGPEASTYLALVVERAWMLKP